MNTQERDQPLGLSGEAAAPPEPPWWPARRSPTPARAPLSREAIVEGALRVLDRDGLDGVSMRAVAQELGTGAASLYWHVRNKEALLELAVDRVLGEIALPPADPTRWQEQLKEVARTTRAVFRRHRDIARFTLGRVPLGPSLVRIAEWQLGLLRAAGVPDRACAYAGDLYGLYVGAYGTEESMAPQSPTGEELPSEAIVGMARDYFRSLPPDRFPNLVALADEVMRADPDDRFEFGLDLLVRGLAAQIPQRPPPPEAA